MERRTFIKRYSTGWLFVDSRPFLYSHLPEEDAYQYYAPVLTAADFMREAYIEGTTVTFEFDVPDTNQYEGNIFARYTNGEKPQDRIDIGTYEGDWLPRAEALFNVENPKDRKITEKELEYFKSSFYKVMDNGCYYMSEDQFDTPRNNAVLKIQKLLDISVTMLENVLNFNIKAASGYQGFGNGVLKYPYTFSTYNQLSDTQLVAPKTGTLKAGSQETFVISSKNYSSFAIILGDQWNFFTKNSTTGNFELSLAIPVDVDSIKISGSTSKTGTHWGLVQYNIVP
jgi:hypothetical protein